MSCKAYSSYTVERLLEQNGACVTADYQAQADGSVSVINSARFVCLLAIPDETVSAVIITDLARELAVES